MGITIKRTRLEEVLERAVLVAESDAPASEIWIGRTRRIEDCPSKTYIAALGTALLAKSCDARVDTLSVKVKAGPSAYSMRGVVSVLVEKASIYGYHLGATGPEPLNNQPWFHAIRVDRMTNIHPGDAPFHRDILRFLTDLNGHSEQEAFDGLVAFIRLRLEAGELQRATRAKLRVETSSDLLTLIEVITGFIQSEPEGGRRGQALVAALFDCSFSEVYLAPINSPVGLDVEIHEDGRLVLGIEVKQKGVTEETALHLAEEAARVHADKALLVALSRDQPPLDRERIRAEGLRQHGVLTAVWESVGELVTEVALQSACSATEFAERISAAYLRRLQEHGLSQSGLENWVDLTHQIGR